MTTGEVKTLLFSDGVTVSPPTQVQVANQITDTTNWNNTQTTVTYDTSALMPDARLATWTLKNSSYKQVQADISSADATHVTVTVDEPLPSGTYYLFGIY